MGGGGESGPSQPDRRERLRNFPRRWLGFPHRAECLPCTGTPTYPATPRLPRWARLRNGLPGSSSWAALETGMGPVGGERGGRAWVLHSLSVCLSVSLSGPVCSPPPHWPLLAPVAGSLRTGLPLPSLSQSWFSVFLSPTSSDRLGIAPPTHTLSLCPLLPHTTSNLDPSNANTLFFSIQR